MDEQSNGGGRDDVEAGGARFDDETPPSVAVVRAVASLAGVEPTETNFKLYDCIDPDALDSLFEGTTVRWVSLEFDVDGYRVRVKSDGSVVARNR